MGNSPITKSRQPGYDPLTVQLRLPWLERRAQTGNAARSISIAGRVVPLRIARHRLARRYIVRVAPDGSVRLTVPRSASIAGGLAFAERQAAWVERQWQRQRLRAAPWTTGTSIWFRGDLITLVVDAERVLIGPEHVRLPAPGADVRAAVEGHIRSIAEQELLARCVELARDTGVDIARVTVRNQRSRWGACSSRRVITLNWRLVQMPPSVSDYIILHELMHVRQPNHSRRFWREVGSVCAWWREAERWIRRYGKEIL